MGGDKGPSEVLAGLIKSSSFVPRDLRYILFGPEDELGRLISASSEWKGMDFEIRHSPEVVQMDEKPIAGIKNKKKSSMALALQALKDAEADAMLCCGNTGCLMAGEPFGFVPWKGLRDQHFALFGLEERGILLYLMPERTLIPSHITFFKTQYLVQIMPGLHLDLFVLK